MSKQFNSARAQNLFVKSDGCNSMIKLIFNNSILICADSGLAQFAALYYMYRDF